MRIVLDNKSYHDAVATIEGRVYNLRPQQIVYAEVYNTQPLNIKIQHNYSSRVINENIANYIIVIDTEYSMYGVTDGAVLTIAHDRSRFSLQAVYERFFISFPLMFRCTEKHTVTNFEEINKHFKKKYRGELLFDCILEGLFDGLFSLPWLLLIFILAWIFSSIQEALALTGTLLLVDVIGIFFICVPISVLIDKSGNRRRRRKRRKGRNVEEVVLQDLKGISESAAISAYYADPRRTVIDEDSRYEG